MEQTDFIIIVPPARSTNTVYPPYGALYIATSLNTNGYNAKILDTDADRKSIDEIVDEIRKINPRYIAFSGIVSPSYTFIKELSRQFRKEFPEKKQILGGGLSISYDALFTNTDIDIIVLGEGDITIVELLGCLDSQGDLSLVNGICYKKDSSYVKNPPRELIKDLDSLPYPDFSLIDIQKYLPDGRKFVKSFNKKYKNKNINKLVNNNKKYMLTIPTSRGCYGSCSFCFRAYKGVRVHSIKYVFDFIEYLMDTYDIGFFTLGDECFANVKKRNWDFLNEYKKRNMNFVYRILGLRVDSITEDVMKAYSESNCWMIEFGFESGSQKMLDVMNKKVSIEQNRQVALWAKKYGIYTSPTVVIGMPGETNQTIDETINFIKSIDYNYKQYQYTYALPIPGSFLYNFARVTGTIKDEDEYLTSLAGNVSGAGIAHVNLTDCDEKTMLSWAERINNGVTRDYFEKRTKVKLFQSLMKIYMQIIYSYKTGTLLQELISRVKGIFVKKEKKSTGSGKPVIPYKKSDTYNVEKLLVKAKEHYPSKRKISLKEVNDFLSESVKD